MDNLEQIENIKNLILTHKKPSHQTTNKKEVSVRCPYCGDSKSNQSATHFYIEMKPPFRFHCFKCETSGVLNSETLRDLGIFNPELSLGIVNANKNLKMTSGIQKVSYKKRRLVNNPYDTEISTRNVRYFNNRYGTHFDNTFIIEKFKTVTDPICFFKDNNIYVPKGQYDFENAIGFISSDASHIIFRDVSGRQPRRYFNLNLCQNEIDTISKTYNISNCINIMSNTVDLIITEGIFDIIGVYNHFYLNNDKDKIFAAACGKAFNAVILNYIRMGFLNMNISIYSDGDVNTNFYKSLKTSSPYLKNTNITVYYNSLYDPKTGFGKDYGVPANQIQLTKIII